MHPKFTLVDSKMESVPRPDPFQRF